MPNEIYRNLDAVGDGEKWWEVVSVAFFPFGSDYCITLGLDQ